MAEELLRYPLQAREHQDHYKRRRLPDVRKDDRMQRRRRVP